VLGSVLVVVPTFNERENLSVLIPRILQQPNYHVLVVDDASPDGTGEVADAFAQANAGRVSVLHRTGPRGLGRAYIAGMKHALASGIPVICQMDADHSHDPKYLPDLVSALDKYDVVIGSRYLDGISVVNWPLRRLALSTFANFYVRTVIGLTVRDCTSGFRCWRRSALASLPLDRIASDGYAFQFETLYEAAQRGYRLGEVRIVFFGRHHGTSKMTRGVILESALAPWGLLLRRGRRITKGSLVTSESHGRPAVSRSAISERLLPR
jgi:dolichol-phosphate mannosyltransferase